MAFEETGSNAPPHPAWIINAFRDIEIPYNSIFSIYHDIFEKKPLPFTTNAALTYLIRAILQCIKQWLETMRQTMTSGYDRYLICYTRNEFPARLVDEAISKYLITLQQDGDAILVQQLKFLQSQVRSY